MDTVPIDTVQVLVNDDPTELLAGTTLSGLLAELNVKPRGVAVAVNAEVIPQLGWDNTTLKSGDAVLIITATQGG
ncbi:MAG: sulfur carrier protein ThiS [Proteobacteria bacterium]|nr:sulfur carrier protein ThiS [Pseudomonadota bacterium]